MRDPRATVALQQAAGRLHTARCRLAEAADQVRTGPGLHMLGAAISPVDAQVHVVEHVLSARIADAAGRVPR
jgi:hypothetical protein